MIAALRFKAKDPKFTKKYQAVLRASRHSLNIRLTLVKSEAHEKKGFSKNRSRVIPGPDDPGTPWPLQKDGYGWRTCSRRLPGPEDCSEVSIVAPDSGSNAGGW